MKIPDSFGMPSLRPLFTRTSRLMAASSAIVISAALLSLAPASCFAQTVLNPGFETGSLTNWLGGGSSYGVNTASPHAGTYNCYNNGSWNSVFQNVSGLKTNTSYTLKVWARLGTAVTGNNHSIYISTDNGTTKTRTYISGTAYQQYSVTFNTGSATTVQVGEECSTGVSLTAYLDDFTLTENTGGGGTTSPTGYQLGISISANEYGTRAFADLFKSDARVWQPGTSNIGPTDANGMPTTDCDIFTLDGGYAQNVHTAAFNGTYQLSFNGQATLGANGGTIQNQVYTSGTNQTTANLVVSTTYPTISVTFRNTRRTSGSALNTGVTNLHLMRPTTVGGTTTYPTNTIFTNEYLAICNRGVALRSMDFVATNGNVQKNWSERHLLNDLTYYDNPTGTYGWQGKGAPWEAFISLCNINAKDCWVNVPLYASDDYVTQLATLLKNTLGSQRNIYVEYTNEVWNFGFAQFGQVQDLARAEVQSNPNSTLNFDGACINSDGSFNGSIATPRYWVRRSMQISNIFRTVFGDAAMMTRVRPLFETQAGWTTWIANGLVYLDQYYNNRKGNYVTTPHPVNYFFWGGGGSGYLQGFPDSIANNPNATVNDIFTGYSQSWTGHYNIIASDTDWCAAFGMKRVAYESGPGEIHGAAEPAVLAAQLDPRIKDVWKQTADVFYQAGGELYMHFLPVNSTHGLLPYDAIVGSQVTYKRTGFDELMASSTRPAPTIGTLLPATIFAGRYRCSSDTYSVGNSDSSVNFGATYGWLSFTVRSPAAGSRSIVLNTSASSGGQARVYVNGTLAGTVTCPNGGNSTALVVSLPSGVSGIKIERSAGSFTLNTFSVN